MGDYVNPGVDKFQISLNSAIYVDKSELIAKINPLIWTRQRFICISRPRRFGKTMAAEMLAAYYSREDNAQQLFKNLKISKDANYEKHLNQYDTIMINVQEFSSKTKTVTRMLAMIQTKIIRELQEIYPNLNYDENDFIQVMKDVYKYTRKPFIILIDEWDCLFREYKDDFASQKEYLDFLRLWLKDQVYVGLAYMTGILPIKKYGTHSALNMFREYSMIDPFHFIEYFGFRDYEVEKLCAVHGMDFEEVKRWYNGYFIERETPILNPTSISQSLESKKLGNYWNKTETYESLKNYIKLDFDEMQKSITQLIAGEKCTVNPDKFANDMSTFNSKDDVLTLLVHLGYLSYCEENNSVKIPNEEVKCEFINSIEDLTDWDEIIAAIHESKVLLQAVWAKEAETVATGMQKIHEKNTSIFEYNDENSLSCVLNLALYSASNYYTVVRELPTGKGFADLVFIPRKKFIAKPAIVVELKWDKTVKGAIAQIKEKNYLSALEEHHGNLLLVGINYDKKLKHYECMIESLEYGNY